MEWGRIADDGTVFVRTADGEREIGSWQAGDRAAGLAYYVRRYEDLETEVRLLEKRLESGTGDPAATRRHAGELREKLDTAAAIGDLAALAARLDALVGAADEKAGAAAAARQQARADAVAAKEALVAEAEGIAQSASDENTRGAAWKASGDRLRAIVEDWRQIKGVDRRTDDALWKRFAAARDAFARRRGQHFAALDAERGQVKAVKERLIARAEELSTSNDWRETSAALRDLMTEWKAAGRAGREVEDALWARFRAAQDAFYARRSETFAERDAEQVANQRLKEEVVAAAEALDVSDPRSAQVKLRDLQERYDEIGHVPRDAMRRIEDRMRAAETRVRDALDSSFRASSQASNPFLAAMRERLAEAEAKLERARKSGDEARIAKATAEVEQRRSLIPD